MNDVPMTPADHILVVEDDPIGGRQLARFLPKPFEPLELEALLAAVLRRRRLMEERLAAPQTERTAERWQVSTHERCLKLDGTLRIPLSDIELRFLSLLHDEAPATVARDAIIRVLGRPENLYTRARLDTAISRLRHKIATVADQPAPFTSVYGTGYVWVQRPAAAQPPRAGPEPGKNSSELV